LRWPWGTIQLPPFKPHRKDSGVDLRVPIAASKIFCIVRLTSHGDLHRLSIFIFLSPDLASWLSETRGTPPDCGMNPALHRSGKACQRMTGKTKHRIFSIFSHLPYFAILNIKMPLINMVSPTLTHAVVTPETVGFACRLLGHLGSNPSIRLSILEFQSQKDVSETQ
jgi:hypothetical protein